MIFFPEMLVVGHNCDQSFIIVDLPCDALLIFQMLYVFSMVILYHPNSNNVSIDFSYFIEDI